MFLFSIEVRLALIYPFICGFMGGVRTDAVLTGPHSPSINHLSIVLGLFQPELRVKILTNLHCSPRKP